MSFWDRLVYVLLLCLLLPYIREIQPADFVQLSAKTQAIFTQPIAALSLVAELPTHHGVALLHRFNTCTTSAALGCQLRVPALRHPTPSSCLISELTFVRVLAAFLPEQPLADVFRSRC